MNAWSSRSPTISHELPERRSGEAPPHDINWFGMISTLALSWTALASIGWLVLAA